MSEGIGIDIPSPSDFVRLDTASSQQVIDVLTRTLEIRHGVRDSHESG